MHIIPPYFIERMFYFLYTLYTIFHRITYIYMIKQKY
nr:MAG TPA: Protealysin propeptide [Caudoviricetes sp.]